MASDCFFTQNIRVFFTHNIWYNGITQEYHSGRSSRFLNHAGLSYKRLFSDRRLIAQYRELIRFQVATPHLSPSLILINERAVLASIKRGIEMTLIRKETDSLGVVDVPADKLWARKRSGLWSILASAMILFLAR